MFTTGGTGGGPGSPGYFLSLAQFQQRVASATVECRLCLRKKGYSRCKAEKICNKRACCRFCRCAPENPWESTRTCCSFSVSSCSSQKSSCLNCPCSSSSSSSSSSSKHHHGRRGHRGNHHSHKDHCSREETPTLIVKPTAV